MFYSSSNEEQSDNISLEIINIPEEFASIIDIELELSVPIINKLYKDNLHQYHLTKNIETDDMFIVELSPCNNNEIKYEVSEQKLYDLKFNNTNPVESSLQNGRFYSIIYPIANTNYLSVTSDLSPFDKFACKFKFYNDTKEQCNLDINGGSEYWVKYYSTNKNYFKTNKISNKGNNEYLLNFYL